KRLSDLGITSGMPVALFAENSAAWIVSYLGLQWIGATVVGMNPAFKETEAAQILADSAAAAVLVDAGRQPLIDRLRARLPALQTTSRVEDVGSSHPSPLVGESQGGGPLNPESPALLLYTSGTTGKPKGALLDHGNLLAQGRGVVEAWRWTAEARLVLALPLFHVHGLAIALHGSLIAGGCAVLVPFSPENVVRELRAGGTMFFGVPAMYQRLADYLEKNPADLRHVRLFVAGSAPLPATLFARCGSGHEKPKDRKSTRLNSSHLVISYAVFCLKKKKTRVPSTSTPTGILLRRLASFSSMPTSPPSISSPAATFTRPRAPPHIPIGRALPVTSCP